MVSANSGYKHAKILLFFQYFGFYNNLLPNTPKWLAAKHLSVFPTRSIASPSLSNVWQSTGRGPDVYSTSCPGSLSSRLWRTFWPAHANCCLSMMCFKVIFQVRNSHGGINSLSQSKVTCVKLLLTSIFLHASKLYDVPAGDMTCWAFQPFTEARP